MLDTAAARVLLRKVGGGYLFVHLLLLEHSATMAEDNVSPDRATLRATNDPDAERGPSYGEADGAMDMVNFNPPGGRPICVAGLHWLGLVITSRHTAPVVAAIEWRTSRGERASNHQTVLHELLARTHEAWGREVRHVFDRGFASGSWLHTLLERELRFVLRWKKGQKLLDGWGELRKAW